MAGEIQVTLIGNMTADPELRYSPGGDAVANFTVASTPRVYKDGAWVDGEASFMRVAAWRKLGENVAESFRKGSRVVVVGKIKQRSWETKEGQKRTDWVMDAEDVAGSVMFQPVTITAGDVNRAGAEKANDLWGGSTGGASDDPPF